MPLTFSLYLHVTHSIIQRGCESGPHHPRRAGVQECRCPMGHPAIGLSEGFPASQTKERQGSVRPLETCVCVARLWKHIVWRGFLRLSLLREAQLGASDPQEPPTGVSALVLAYKDDLRRAEGLAAGGGTAAAPLHSWPTRRPVPAMHLSLP